MKGRTRKFRDRRRPRSVGGEEIDDDDEDDYEEENAGNFVIVVVLGSLMGEETRDEEIETMTLNTYPTKVSRSTR